MQQVYKGVMMADIDLAGLLQRFLSEYTTARTERQDIYEAGQTDLSKVAEMYEPGGGITAGLLQERMAPVEQSMVSRGLTGTTRPGAVRAGMAADIEAQRMTGLAGAKTAKAEFGADFEDIYPTAGTISHLATGGFSGLLSREIAEAGAVPDYASRVDYNIPSATPTISGSSAGGGAAVNGGLGTDKYSDDLFGQLNEGGGGAGGSIDLGGLQQGGYIDWTKGLAGTNRAEGKFVGTLGTVQADPKTGLIT